MYHEFSFQDHEFSFHVSYLALFYCIITDCSFNPARGFVSSLLKKKLLISVITAPLLEYCKAQVPTPKSDNTTLDDKHPKSKVIIYLNMFLHTNEVLFASSRSVLYGMSLQWITEAKAFVG